MILLIIFAIIGGFISYLHADEGHPFDWGALIGGIVITAIVYFVVLLTIRVAISDSQKYYTYEYKDQPIESLVNKGAIASGGSFILGCGSVSGGSYEYYVSYANFPQGSLRIKVNAYKAYVKETNEESPTIKNYWVRRVHKGYKSPWIWNREPRNGEWDKNLGYFNTSDIIVIVPKNTIYKEFKIED